MVKLILTRGYSGSGKTSYAKDWLSYDSENRLRTNRDDLRESLFNQQGVLSQDKEGIVTSVQRSVAKKALQQGKDVVCDDTNLVRKYAVEWANLAQEVGAEFEVVDFKTPLEECLRRNLERASIYEGRFVPEDAIRKQAARFPFKQWGTIVAKEGVSTFEVVPYERAGMMPVYLVDVDGTVAQMGDRRGPFDWDKVGLDTPRMDVIRVVNELSNNAEIIFLSGRDGSCYAETLEWLSNYTFLLDAPIELYMRTEGDMRPDYVVKYELFNQHARHHNIRGVFDDRPMMNRLWRKLGITTFDVGDGVEF